MTKLLDHINLPNHVAMIMDGNGRWASARGLTRKIGHIQGSKNFDKIVKHAEKIGIKHLTLYAFSTENWKRSEQEITVLMKLFENKLKRSLLDTKNSNLKIKIIGKKSDLPNNVFELSKKLEEISKNNAGMRLNIAINYGSRQEIIMVTKKIAQKVLENEIEIKDISENTFCKNLYTQDQPDVDLLIRTGGEFRISNFLLWQISYAEIFFTKTFWPDFSPNDFDEAIEEYKKRNRRFGGNMVSSF